MTIKEIVEKNYEILKEMNQVEMTLWAKSHGIDSRAGFWRFKKHLKTNGIDYDKMRKARFLEKPKTESGPITHAVTLFCDACVRINRFAICDKLKNPVWYGYFAWRDEQHNFEQARAELGVAKKAIWLASQCFDLIEGETKKIQVNLMVDPMWLRWSRISPELDPQGKMSELEFFARKYDVDLKFDHVQQVDNPASSYILASKYQSWRDYDIKNLIENKL